VKIGRLLILIFLSIFLLSIVKATYFYNTELFSDTLINGSDIESNSKLGVGFNITGINKWEVLVAIWDEWDGIGYYNALYWDGNQWKHDDTLLKGLPSKENFTNRGINAEVEYNFNGSNKWTLFDGLGRSYVWNGTQWN